MSREVVSWLAMVKGEDEEAVLLLGGLLGDLLVARGVIGVLEKML
jgi:hypothetical protein